MSDQFERERELQRRNREATALYELGRQVNSSFHVDVLVPGLVQNILWILECHFAGLALLVPGSGKAIWRAVSGGRAAVRDTPVGMDDSVAWRDMLARRSAVVLSHDGAALHGEDPLAKFVGQEALQAVAAVPLAHAETVFGALVCAYRSPHVFSSEEIRFLSHLADTTSLGLENARLYLERVEDARRLQALTSRLHAVQEEERGRVSRELQDGVGQLLVALRMELEFLRRAGSEGRDAEPGRLGSLTALIDDILAEIRKMAFDLRPAILDHSGLPAAVRVYTERFARETGLQITCTGSEEIGRWDSRVEATVFRIVQEALANVAKHADATAVTVELNTAGAALTLRLTDDGRGFVPERGRDDGFGILGMRQRVMDLGGTFGVESQPGKGTTVRVTIPRIP